jgi:Galactose-3-O-sulfotransferase
VSETVIFLHIGKTAGSTMRQILKRQFPPSQTMTVRARRRPREETLADFAALPESERLRPRLIMGHTVFGLHEHVPRPCRYVTMLRDPVRLAISQHRYVLRTPGHRHHEQAQGMSLADYVESGLALEMDNSQTRAVAGDIGTPYRGCTPEMLETAKQNLAEHFAWVGITERFDESVVLLGRTFGWRDVRYVSANVARGGTPPTEAELELVRQANHLDQELYDHAGGLLDERIAAEPGFAAAIEEFQAANERYARWGRLTYTLPSRIKRRLVPAVRHKTG